MVMDDHGILAEIAESAGEVRFEVLEIDTTYPPAD
jgi:hypothetical protein